MKIAFALAFALAVPTAALACAGHQEQQAQAPQELTKAPKVQHLPITMARKTNNATVIEKKNAARRTQVEPNARASTQTATLVTK
jgi:hypothetical protein